MSKKHRLRPAFVLALSLTSVPASLGYVELFMSRDGVQNYALDTTSRDYLPYFPYLDPAYPRPTPIPFGTQLSGAASLEAPFFLWGRFVNEPAGSRLTGIMPAVRTADAGNIALGPNVIYRHEKRNGPVSERWIRWDGTYPIGINQPIGAITQNGILNGAQAFDLVCADPNNGGTVVALIGGFQLDASGADPQGALYLGLGGAGLAMYAPDHPYLPEVRIGGAIVQEYADPYPGIPGTPTIHPPPGPYLTFAPEPAALVAAFFSVCLLRQKR
jgi:hypothetical protein